MHHGYNAIMVLYLLIDSTDAQHLMASAPTPQGVTSLQASGG